MSVNCGGCGKVCGGGERKCVGVWEKVRGSVGRGVGKCIGVCGEVCWGVWS